jgi:multidrug efflux pump subunit AcrB
MTAADVTAALQEQNAQVAAGTVGATPQMKGQTFEYSVLVKGRLQINRSLKTLWLKPCRKQVLLYI